MKRDKLFISYRRAEDQWAVGHLRERLYDEFGSERVFFDNDAIVWGEKWQESLRAALESSAAVVMVFGSGWYGRRGDGSRRIDEADDPVRNELLEAERLGTPVIPVMIDKEPQPTAADLPAELHFLLERQFRKLHAADSLDKQTDRLILDIRKVMFGRSLRGHFLKEALWIAAVSVAFVWLAQAAGLLGVADDAFSRTVQQLLASRSGGAPAGYAVIEVDDDDYRELFGGHAALDPEVMSIFVNALHAASQAQSSCSPDAPVGFSIELAPGEAGASDRRFVALARALRRLAACRPVVLACPQSVQTGEPPEGDRRWLRLLVDERAGQGAPVILASTRIDSAVLRYSRERLELGAVVGDLAARRRPMRDDIDNRQCACVWNEQWAGRCDDWQSAEGLAQRSRALDTRGIVVPFRAERRNFSEALLAANELAARPVLMVGAGFGTQGRFNVQGLSDFERAGASGAMVHAFLARSVSKTPLAAGKDAEGGLGKALGFGIDLLAAFGTSVMLMMCWRGIASYPHRYSVRALNYAGVAAVFIGVPVACIAVAMLEPRLLPVAMSVAAVGVVTSLRSAMSGFEVLLNSGVAWKSFAGLWSATVSGRDRRSARIRLAAACGEWLLVAAAALVVWQSLEVWPW